VNDLSLAHRSAYRQQPDHGRVVARLFIPGQELTGGSEARTASTVARVLAVDHATVVVSMNDLYDRFRHRHDDIEGLFDRHAQRVIDYVDGTPLSPEHRQLLGAVFTHEFALEGAAVCNPSLVVHPDQTGLAPGALRFVMSFRAIGEGHISSLCFRSGVVDEHGDFQVDPAAAFPVIAATNAGVIDRETVHCLLRDRGCDGPTAASVLDTLPELFSVSELENALARSAEQSDTRVNVAEITAVLRDVAPLFYEAHFSPEVELSRRVLWPATVAESRGMEDARFVLTDEDGQPVYRASYTAFDGAGVTQQVLTTTDFVHFTSAPLTGLGARNKGLAFFPRPVGGRFRALSRHDRESNVLVSSDSQHCWDETSLLQIPESQWELIQLGNCGSPIEVAGGWLVLTHGVGPMRTYSLGAIVLDLEDPSRVRAVLPGPLLVATPREQDGYVPNVLYSCGSLVHAGILHVVFGIADQSIGHATVNVDALLAAMVETDDEYSRF